MNHALTKSCILMLTLLLREKGMSDPDIAIYFAENIYEVLLSNC